MWLTCKKCGWEGETNRDCKPCKAAYNKQWKKRNPDKVKASNRRYKAKFKTERREEYNAQLRRLRKYTDQALMKRRWQEFLLAGDVTRLQMIEIYEQAKGLCFYCGKKVRVRFSPLDPLGYDHVIPRSKGGLHTASNMVICCKQCNCKKRDSSVEDFIEQHFDGKKIANSTPKRSLRDLDQCAYVTRGGKGNRCGAMRWYHDKHARHKFVEPKENDKHVQIEGLYKCPPRRRTTSHHHAAGEE